MRLWRHSKKDAILCLISLGQVAITVVLAVLWSHLTLAQRCLATLCLSALIAYSILICAHIFVHTKWFASDTMNLYASALVTLNIAQSVTAYRLMHVRNHHRYNNDRKDALGETQDWSSTYRDGLNGMHSSAHRYAVVGAVRAFLGIGTELRSALLRGGRLYSGEVRLVSLLSRSNSGRKSELSQICRDRIQGQRTLTC
jgi:fatty acid desaturase